MTEREASCGTAEITVLPSGKDLWLVGVRRTGTAGFFRSDIVRLLEMCQEFRSIDDHVTACAKDGVSGRDARALRGEIVRLLHAGFLITPEMPSLVPPTRRPVDDAIACLGFPTCDRVQLLHRAIASYVDNAAGWGRSVDVVVADDSPGSHTRRLYRTMLQELANARRVSIRYVGWDEKQLLIDAIATRGAVPREVVAFACLGDRRRDVSVGANRNVLLLLTQGQRLLMADDDTVCRVGLPPGVQHSVDVRARASGLETRCFRTRGDAFAAVQYVEEDLLAHHEGSLGAMPRDIIASVGGQVSVCGADAATLYRVRDEPGRVRITVVGTVGDCGWDNADYYLGCHVYPVPGQGHAGAPWLEAREATNTREVINSVPRITIVGFPDLPNAMCLGLDNTGLLPPFVPVGRGEDVAFGASLAACFPGSYVAFLPRLVQHDPTVAKSFGYGPMFAIHFASWLPACIGMIAGGQVEAPEARLRWLGQNMQEIARFSRREFDSFVLEGRWRSASALICSVEAKLEQGEETGREWRRAARAFIARVRRNALVPVEEGYALIGGRGALRDLLTRFGQLLEWWPVIQEAAGEVGLMDEQLADRLSV